MAVLQSFRMILRVVTETPVLTAFTLVFGPVGTLNNASGPAGTIGSLLQLLAMPTLIGVFCTVANGARPGSGTDLRASTAVQYYYVSLLDTMPLVGSVVFVAAMVVGSNVLGYVGFDQLNAVLNDSASLTPVELVVSGATLVVLMAAIYIFIFFDIAIVPDGQTAGEPFSRSVDFVLSSLRAVASYAVVAVAMTSVTDLPVLWPVALGGATIVAGAVTAFQAPMSAVDIAVVAVGSTITTLVSRTYKICSYRICADAVPGANPESGGGGWTA